MRPWMIVLSSAAVAIAAAAGVAVPELSLTPHSATVPVLVPLLPTLVVTALAGYALCAILLTAANLVVGCLLLRRRVARLRRSAVRPAPTGRRPLPLAGCGGWRRCRFAAAAAGETGRTVVLRRRFARKRRDGRWRASITSGRRAPISLAH